MANISHSHLQYTLLSSLTADLPGNLHYDMQIVLGSFVIIINLLIYGWLGLRQIRQQV